MNFVLIIVSKIVPKDVRVLGSPIALQTLICKNFWSFPYGGFHGNKFELSTTRQWPFSGWFWCLTLWFWWQLCCFWQRLKINFQKLLENFCFEKKTNLATISKISPFLVLAVTVFHQDKFFEVIDLELLEEFVEVFELLGSQPLKKIYQLLSFSL